MSCTSSEKAKQLDSSSIHVTFTTDQLHYFVDEAVLRGVFEAFGEVLDITIKKFDYDVAHGAQRGYGFVHFKRDEAGVAAALRCTDELRNAIVDGTRYKCDVSHKLMQELYAQSHPSVPALLLRYPSFVKIVTARERLAGDRQHNHIISDNMNHNKRYQQHQNDRERGRQDSLISRQALEDRVSSSFSLPVGTNHNEHHHQQQQQQAGFSFYPQMMFTPMPMAFSPLPPHAVPQPPPFGFSPSAFEINSASLSQSSSSLSQCGDYSQASSQSQSLSIDVLAATSANAVLNSGPVTREDDQHNQQLRYNNPVFTNNLYGHQQQYNNYFYEGNSTGSLAHTPFHGYPSHLSYSPETSSGSGSGGIGELSLSPSPLPQLPLGPAQAQAQSMWHPWSQVLIPYSSYSSFAMPLSPGVPPLFAFPGSNPASRRGSFSSIQQLQRINNSKSSNNNNSSSSRFSFSEPTVNNE
jgi:hypothetical protein